MAFKGFNNLRPPNVETSKYVPTPRVKAGGLKPSVTVTVYLTGWDWGVQDFDNPNTNPNGGQPSDNNREPLPTTAFTVEVESEDTLEDVLMAMWDKGCISGEDGTSAPEFVTAPNVIDPNAPDVVYLSAMRVPPGVPSVLNYYDEQGYYTPDPPQSGSNKYTGISWIYYEGIPSERPPTISDLPEETIDLMKVSSENCTFTFSYDAVELSFLLP